MPAKSKAQQRFMGMVHAVHKGEKPASAKVAKVASRIDKGDAEDYASTKHTGKPERVKQETKVRSLIRKMVREIMSEGDVLDKEREKQRTDKEKFRDRQFSDLEQAREREKRLKKKDEGKLTEAHPWTLTVKKLIDLGFGNLEVSFKGMKFGKVKDFLKHPQGNLLGIKTHNTLLKKKAMVYDYDRQPQGFNVSKTGKKYFKGTLQLEGKLTEAPQKGKHVVYYEKGSSGKKILDVKPNYKSAALSMNKHMNTGKYMTVGIQHWESWNKVESPKIKEAKERNYKEEYKKFQSSDKSKKYRAELNQYNRKKGTYGNGDGKDASHKGGKIAGFEKESVNRGRAEKSRLKKEGFAGGFTKDDEEFEDNRKKQAEVLGYKLTGKEDIKVEIGKLTEVIKNIVKEIISEGKKPYEIILQQLGGNKFIAMTGAKNLGTSGNKKNLSFNIGRNAKSINHVKITLTSADLYDMEFIRIRAGKVKVVKKVKGVYNDQLGKIFTKYTGMNVRL